jgi:uncharacterized membrane protein
VAAVVLSVNLLSLTPAEAKKPTEPPGGGGGEAAYEIVAFMPDVADAVESWVSDINDVGHAVGGILLTDGTTQAVHLDLVTGDYTLLAGGSDSVAAGVNNLNQIVGSVGNRAAFWPTPSSAPILLPFLAGNDNHWTRQINDAGIIVGGSNNSAPPGVAVVWSATVDELGVMQIDGPLPLLPLSGDSESAVSDINEAVGGVAQAVGHSHTNEDYQAVVWTVSVSADGTLGTPGLPQSVGTLGLNSPSTSRGQGLNNWGDVCGISDKLPFVAVNGDPPEALSVPRNAAVGYALGINDFGKVVGEVTPALKKNQTIPSKPNAYLWRDGQAIELIKQIDPNSGWESLWGAHTITNDGMIAGQGAFDGIGQGFLLIPN